MHPTQLRKASFTCSVVVRMLWISVLLASSTRAHAQFDVYLSDLLVVERYTVLSATSLKEEQGRLLLNGQFEGVSTVTTWPPGFWDDVFLPVSGYFICQQIQFDAFNNSSFVTVKNVVRSDRVYRIRAWDYVVVCIKDCDPNVPFITSESPLPRATPNQPYSYPLRVDSGTSPFTWSVVSGYGALPQGLSLASNSGIIGGTPSQIGTNSFRVRVTDSKQRAVDKQLTHVVSPPLQPNLTPYQPSGWQDKIVVSRTTGTSTDSSSLTTADTLYVDWAFINNGTTPTAVSHVTELYVDDILRQSWSGNPPVSPGPGFFRYFTDYVLGSLTAGTHTLKLKVDAAGAIDESNETDNEYTKIITVVATVPTLTVTAPNGGENWVVNSTRTVSWNISGSTGNIAYFKIALSTDGGVNYSTELTPSGLFTPSLRTWNWQIPSSLNSAQARIRVRALDLNSNILAQDSSDGNFTISGGDFPQPDFSLPAYRQDNPLWRAGFAPQSVNTPNPQLGNALGNCTWYANGRLRQLGFVKADLDLLINDASLWDNIAIQKGIPVSNIPVVGAIAQTDVGAEGRGHVAVIERVNGDGTITVSESSFAGENPPPTSEWNFLYRVRTAPPNWFQRFIHVRKTLLTGVAGAALQPPKNGVFQFEVSAANQQQIVVQTSEDLFNWVDAGTVTITGGKGIFSDSTAGSRTKRFYRPKP